MRLARILRTALAATTMGLLGASWTSCNSADGASAQDAGEDADAANPADATTPDVSSCNPCTEICSCVFAETLSGSCTTLSCPASGTWGGPGFCTSGCVDATDDGPFCDPCTTACACLTGFPPRFDPSTCSLVSCVGPGSMGTWGPGVFCKTARTCDGGAVDASPEAAVDAGPEAAVDAGPGAAADAGPEAGPPGDASAPPADAPTGDALAE